MAIDIENMAIYYIKLLTVPVETERLSKNN